jgi:Reverse transcriptase (RNA-dependent DNA polymerase)
MTGKRLEGQSFRGANDSVPQRSGPHRVDCSVPQGSVLGPQEFIAYTEELECLIDRHCLGHHLYADDTQLIDGVRPVDIFSSVCRLQQCIEEIHRWCASRRLQLNPSKTEVIWFGTPATLKKIKDSDLALRVGCDVIKPVDVVRDLGVLLDQELSMKQHVNKVASICFFQLRRLKQVRRILGPEVTTGLITAFITSRLDYCNASLAGLPKSTIAPLQRVQNAAARLVTGTRMQDHVTPALQQLHWLPIKHRIIYKLSVLMHLVHTGRSPAYLSTLVTATSSLASRRSLRSASSQRYEIPRTVLKFGERSFSFAGPSAWNSLPAYLHEQSDTKLFKAQLKSFLFSIAFLC